MEDVVFQNQLYHDVVSDDGDIHLGDEEVVDPDFSNI